MFDFFDFFDDFGIEDWLIIGPLSEDMADEEERLKKIEKDLDDEFDEGDLDGI